MSQEEEQEEPEEPEEGVEEMEVEDDEEVVEDEETEVDEEITEVPEDVERDDGCPSCGTPESEILVVYDRNMDKPWKGGNPYSRICPNCGSRTFSPKSQWLEQETRYVIKRGENEPKPYYLCPYEDCDEQFVGEVDECPGCERPIEWEE